MLKDNDSPDIYLIDLDSIDDAWDVVELFRKHYNR